jgi:hypothetical protein
VSPSFSCKHCSYTTISLVPLLLSAEIVNVIEMA